MSFGSVTSLRLCTENVRMLHVSQSAGTNRSGFVIPEYVIGLYFAYHMRVCRNMILCAPGMVVVHCAHKILISKMQKMRIISAQCNQHIRKARAYAQAYNHTAATINSYALRVNEIGI